MNHAYFNEPRLNRSDYGVFAADRPDGRTLTAGTFTPTLTYLRHPTGR